MTGILTDPHRRHLALTVLVGAGLAAYLAGSIETVYGFDLAMLLALGGGFPIYLDAVGSLARRRISADLAVGIAALAALSIGQYLVAAEVIFIMLIGEALEHVAVDRTRAGIAALLAMRPLEARVRRDGEERVIPAKEILPEDIVLVRPGERIPVDGRVIRGTSSVDQSPITGESLPADKTTGDEIFAGTINLYGAMELSVERVGENTTLEQIIHLVEHAEETRAPVQRLADRYATYFVPAVLLAAGITYVVTTDIIRAVAVLVVACPCALVLATPTAVAAGMGRLVRKGVLIKGGSVLETIGRIRSILLDKTGTLTLGKLRVSQVVAAPGHDEADVLMMGASVEQHSEHPLGRLLAERAASAGIEIRPGEGFLAHPGLGAEATVDGARVLAGSERFLRETGTAFTPELEDRLRELGGAGCTLVVVAREGNAIGAVAVEDTVRPEAREALAQIQEMGIERIAMLTGDNDAAARSVAGRLEIDIGDIRSGLLPAQKVDAVRAMKKDAGPVAMVGDGINDAPSLVAADVGIAMADIGSDITIASADVVLVGGDLRKIPEAISCGLKTHHVIWQNIIGFALSFNVLAVAAASAGWISPVAAAVLHQVSSLTVVLNSLKLLVDARRLLERGRSRVTFVRARWRLAATTATAAALAVYLLSGFHIVRVGQTAVVQHFGRIARAEEPPGIHYRLPYPFGRHFVTKTEEVRRVEVGFRTLPGSLAEPPAYEWNLQHRGGRTERQAEEATVLAGDENLVDVNLVVHYRVADPVRALFKLGPSQGTRKAKWDLLVRGVAETSLRAEMSQRTVDAILAPERSRIEDAVRLRMASILEGCESGLVVEAVRLGDVHPPLDVVPAFREVTSAQEEKEARINDAEAYQFETEALARGKAYERETLATGAATGRVEKAAGEASRFGALANAYRMGRAVTRLRLYLQTVEQLLAGRRKVILDHKPAGARRQLFLGRKGIWNLLPAARTEGSTETETERSGETETDRER